RRRAPPGPAPRRPPSPRGLGRATPRGDRAPPEPSPPGAHRFALAAEMPTRPPKAPLALIYDGPDLERPGRRPPRHELNRLVEVRDVDDRVPTDHFLGLDEGAIGHRHIASLVAPNGRRGQRRLQLVPLEDFAALGLLVPPAEDPLVRRGTVLFCEAVAL